MSLDIWLFKICPPEEANAAFSVGGLAVDCHKELQRLQPTGIVCAKTVGGRIGSNCFSRAWYKDWQAYKVREVYFPDDWRELKPYLRKRMGEHEYFDEPPESGWDFLLIIW